MTQKHKDTLNELIRRERVNKHHEPIPDSTMKDLVDTIFAMERSGQFFAGTTIILLVICLIQYFI